MAGAAVTEGTTEAGKKNADMAGAAVTEGTTAEKKNADTAGAAVTEGITAEKRSADTAGAAVTEGITAEKRNADTADVAMTEKITAEAGKRIGISARLLKSAMYAGTAVCASATAVAGIRRLAAGCPRRSGNEESGNQKKRQ